MGRRGGFGGPKGGFRGPKGGFFGGRKKSYSTESPKVRSTKKLSPKPVKNDEKDEKAPPPSKVAETPTGASRPGRFYSTIADGFNWGAGNAMGHRFVEAIFGPRTIKTEVVLPEKVEVAAISATDDDSDKFKDYTESCSISYNAFQECLYMKGNNLSKCHVFMDSLFECRKNSSSFNF